MITTATKNAALEAATDFLNAGTPFVTILAAGWVLHGGIRQDDSGSARALMKEGAVRNRWTEMRELQEMMDELTCLLSR
jgi:hypothetical protein